MRYMLFVCASPTPHVPADPSTVPTIADWVDQHEGRGARTDGDVLAPPSHARTVRVRDGRTLIAEGPFAETSDRIVGFDLLECDSLDEALAVAAAHPMAHTNLVEVRPFHDWSTGTP